MMRYRIVAVLALFGSAGCSMIERVDTVRVKKMRQNINLSPVPIPIGTDKALAAADFDTTVANLCGLFI